MVEIPNSYRELVENLINLQKMCLNLFKKCGYEEPDYRASIFLNINALIGNIIVICNILLNVQEEKIPQEGFKTLFGLSDSSQIQLMADKLGKFCRMSLVIMIQFQIENLFVNLLQALKPNSKPPRGFIRILDELFKNISISDEDEKKKTLKILQFIRNTYHSNGMHNNEPLTKVIDGLEFKFVKGEGVNCASWTGIPIAIKAAAELIDEIIKTPEIIEILEPIPDQYIEPSD